MVVTGAAVGIGKATAAAFGNAGATVYVVDVDDDAGPARPRRSLVPLSSGAI